MEKYRQFADGGATDADRHCCFQNRSNKQVYNHRAGANHRDDSVDDDDDEEEKHIFLNYPQRITMKLWPINVTLLQ